MTNEKMLAFVNETLEHGFDPRRFFEVRETLMGDIRDEEAKKRHCADIQKAAKNIIKDAKKNAPARPMMHGSWLIDNEFGNKEWQAVCNGYVAMRIFKPVPLEEIDLDKYMPFDINKAMPRGWVDSCTELLNLPSPQELNAHIKTSPKNAQGVIFYDFGEGLPMVNAQYLKWLIDGVENPAAMWTGNPKVGIYIKGDNADAILLPIHKTTKVNA